MVNCLIRKQSFNDLAPVNHSGTFQIDWTGSLSVNGVVIPVENVNYSTNTLNTRINNLSVPEVTLLVAFSQQLFIDGEQLQNYRIDMMNTVTPSLSDDTYLGTLDYEQNVPYGGQLAIEFSGSRWVVGSIDNVTISAVPLPASAWLLGSGLIGLIGLARRKDSH